eukprot:1679696-Amphidinium_carterae.1
MACENREGGNKLVQEAQFEQAVGRYSELIMQLRSLEGEEDVKWNDEVHSMEEGVCSDIEKDMKRKVNKDATMVASQRQSLDCMLLECLNSVPRVGCSFASSVLRPT